MLETPRSFRATGERVPTDDLSGFRWNTGATLRPIAPGEPCPVLFRDIGPAALALFLRGTLPRLARPRSPIVYMRTAEYVVLTDCPPGPEEQNVSTRKSLASILMSMSSASGSTATVAAEV